MSACTECGKAVVARGLCRKHYLQKWRAGAHTEVPLRQRRLSECPSDHAHTLEVCWAEHGCRCSRCTHLRKMERQRRRSRLIAYGRGDQITPPRVPAGPVRDHIVALKQQGVFGLERIADAAQVSRSVVLDVYFGPRGARKLRRPDSAALIPAAAAERIVALQPADIVAALVPPVGTERRLRALVAIGYTESELARRVGMEVGNLSGIILGKRERITAETYRTVCAVFAELWSKPQQGARADQARKLAKRRRWVGPLAWDDIDNDREAPKVDAEAGVDEMAVELALTGVKVKLTPAERRAAIRIAHARRWSDPLIAERLHTTARTVLRIRQELELPAFDYADIQQVGA